MPSFIAQGYDGFTWLKDLETIVSEEAAMTDTDLLLSIFGHDDKSSGKGDSEHSPHAMGIERARVLTVVGKNHPDSLPIARPAVEDRIRFVEV
jgi:hypothetical protein